MDVIGIMTEGDRAAVQVFPLRDGKLIDRYAFHLENVEGQDPQTLLESFCLEYYGSAPSIPRSSSSRPASRPRAARALPLGPCVARASKSARRCAGRSAGWPSWPLRTRSWRSPDLSGRATAVAAGRGTRAAARGAQSREPAARIECFDVSNIQGLRSSHQWWYSRTQPRRRRTTAPSRSAGRRDRTISPRWRRSFPAASRGCGTQRLGRVGRELRVDAEPGCRRRRPRSALGRPGGDPRPVRPSSRRRRRAGEARGRCSCRARHTGRARQARPRPAAPAADPRRGASIRALLPPAPPRPRRRSSRSSTRCQASVLRDVGRSCDISVRPSASSRPRRRASRGCRDFRPARPHFVRPTAQDPEAPDRDQSRSAARPAARAAACGLRRGSGGSTRTTTVLEFSRARLPPRRQGRGRAGRLRQGGRAQGLRGDVRAALRTHPGQVRADARAFARNAGNTLGVVLGAMARRDSRRVMAKRLSETWSIAAIKGEVTAGGETVHRAYAVPLRNR